MIVFAATAAAAAAAVCWHLIPTGHQGPPHDRREAPQPALRDARAVPAGEQGPGHGLRLRRLAGRGQGPRAVDDPQAGRGRQAQDQQIGEW